MLAAALAVRGPRLGHVYVDVATIRDTVTVDTDEPVDLGALPWPDADDWLERLAASPLVAVGEEPGDPRPLRLVGSALYLDRYWREERQVAADLLALAGRAPGRRPGATRLARLFEPGRQRDAAETALRRRFAVIAGGPGTGKTTTVARTPRAAPRAGRPAGRARGADRQGRGATDRGRARRGGEARRRRARCAQRLLGLEASTLHRLLGWRPDTRSRFRHDRGNRLPHDVVVVDETSMVLAVADGAARRGRARRRAADPRRRPRPARLDRGGRRARRHRRPPRATASSSSTRVHRFGAGDQRELADAIRRGDGDAADGRARRRDVDRRSRRRARAVATAGRDARRAR